jgi:hypothetical protein
VNREPIYLSRGTATRTGEGTTMIAHNVDELGDFWAKDVYPFIKPIVDADGGASLAHREVAFWLPPTRNDIL